VPAKPQPEKFTPLAIPDSLAPLVQELCLLYQDGTADLVQDMLADLVQNLHQITGTSSHSNLAKITDDDETSTDHEYLKSWQDILSLRIYVDTDIYGSLDTDPPLIKQDDQETVVQHTDATAAYLQSWRDIAQSMADVPDDLFTRLWGTAELAKILDCSASMLRRAQRNQQLPLQINNLLLDCISHDRKRRLWFVRPVLEHDQYS
jgi:hypothetical protein